VPVKRARAWDVFEDVKEKQGNKSNYLQYYLTEKENEVYGTIRVYGLTGGISHKELAAKVSLDRSNLRKYTNKLMEKGLIRRGQGLQGKYFPTEEPYKDYLFNAFTLGHDFDFNLLKKDEDLVLTDKISVAPEYRDFTGYRRYYEPKFAKMDKVERLLFEISNRIGAYITFVLIQAMNPNNYDSTIPSDESDEAAEEWVRTAVSQILSPRLLNYFKDAIYKATNRYPIGFKAQTEYFKQCPRFRLDRNLLDQVLPAFKDIYPLLGLELEEITNTLPRALDIHKQNLDESRKISRQQKTCDHDWIKKEVEIGKSRYFKYCVKCNKKQQVKKYDFNLKPKDSI
jgi:Winged helix-turn-helix DNA-binding